MEYEGREILEVLQKTTKNYNNFLINVVVKYAQKINAKKIVDFGSGIGFLATRIGNRISEKIDCIEISENLFPYYNDKPNLILHEHLQNFADSSLDLIYSLNVLEHIENDVDYIKLFAQKLNQKSTGGGMLILYVPAFMCLYSSMDKKVGHYQRYSKKELYTKLSADFNIIRCEYADSAGFFVTLLYKIIGSKNGDINKKALYIFDRFIFPLGRLFDIITHGKILGKNILCIAVKK